MFSKKLSGLSILSRLLLLLAIENIALSPLLHATIIQVTSNDGSVGGSGTLYVAIQQADDGDIIDCSPIAGQTIGLTAALPAIGFSITSPSPSITILGSGVTIDGGNTRPGFSIGQGSATITGFTIQNGLSAGGGGGLGSAGGGGATGGGGALFINSGSTMTISAMSLTNNQAVGGAGGAGNANEGAGGGGGGFGGGHGGTANSTVGTGGPGGAGGGGGNNGGTTGGTDRGAGSPNTFTNFAGAGGGGAKPGFIGGGGGSNASVPARSGGSGGQGSATHAAGGGGGAGSDGSGSPGSNAINATAPGTGIGGAGGFGFGTALNYGAGGGGGGGNGGGIGRGASGGGGGFNGSGGAGGIFGGGGGASRHQTGGAGGFGAGGGGGLTGGIDIYGLGGAGGSSSTSAGGGGGSGFGGAIFIQKGGLLIVEDGVTVSGNSTTAGLGGIAAGMSGENGSSLGQDIFIQAGGSITFQINDSISISTPIEGAGLLSDVSGPGLTKSGTGIISLNGVNSYMGDTLIQSGIVNLNGSVSGDVNIQSGGTLSGNATANGNIYNSGTISPGNSIGTIFTTNLFLLPTSIYTVEVNSAGASDMIIATGFAQISGGVMVTPDDLNFTAPVTYTILSASGGVTGAFSSLTSSTPSLMSLIYNPLTVQLTYLPLDAIGFTSVAGNARNAANCFATLPSTPGSDALTVNNALLALNFNDIQAAFEQMGPAQFSGPTQVQLLDAILVRTTYTKHMQQLCYDSNRHCSLWTDGVAQWQHQGNQFGYKDTTLGVTIGIDYCVCNWILGSAFSYTHDNFHWKCAGGKADINSGYGGLYVQWNHNGFYLNAALIGAFNKYRTTRNLSFGTINRHAYSHHNGNEWLTHVGFEYRICQSSFQWTPYLNLDYVFQHERSYTESGADSLDLHVSPKNAMLFQGEVGVSLSTNYKTCNGVIIPMLSLGYINQTPCANKNYHATFANSSCCFTGKGGNYERNLFVPRLAFTYEGFCDRVNVSIYYDGQVGSNYWAQDVAFDLTFRF
jgi:uncharacterized protein with beta-barrel porin domain